MKLRIRGLQPFVWLPAMILAAGCALPGGGAGEAPNEYLLRAEFDGGARAAENGPVLVVGRPRAGAGYDSARMMYVESPNELRAFARNRWAGTPADMTEPLLVAALEATGAFAAVVSAGAGVGGDLRLDTELLRLHQDFTASPSRVRIAIRATLLESASGEVAFSRSFSAEQPAPGNDPASGAAAANAAMEELLSRIADAAAQWARSG